MKLVLSSPGVKGIVANLGDPDTGAITGLIADCPEPGCDGRVKVSFRQEKCWHTSPACAWALRSDPLDVIRRCREEYTGLPDPNAH